MFDQQTIEAFHRIDTPFYYYDMELLRQTLTAATEEASGKGIFLHYALKANSNDAILRMISGMGMGADCVSGNEVSRAISTGFRPGQIVFSGVGKSDTEILEALKHDILSFNCESLQELEVINFLAASQGKIASVALRINPNVHALTHHYITTGLEENKFGINGWELEDVILKLKECHNLELTGLHFHIGSQITDFIAFKNLCSRVNEINQWFLQRHICPRILNLGGGLGIDYLNPDESPIPDFKTYFSIFDELLELLPGQELHLEPGRALVAQCGSLITRVLFIKKGVKINFAICDAGMTELIRPALYQAYHKIQNLTSDSGEFIKYDVVGPICESSDCFGKMVTLPVTARGDLLAIRSTGAYGETMASRYNLRDLVKAHYSDELLNR
ncbi:MAG: diaminopimelate decarboxylase [Bacteroidetes bacterium]|nr:diaminopimelate decarboxylase [Bacteroidota bacterium]